MQQKGLNMNVSSLLNGASVSSVIVGADLAAPLTIREAAQAFTDAQVAECVDALDQSFERRDFFEIANNLDLDASNSYTKARDKMLANKVSVARFLLALDVQPSAVIERKVAETKMFNAKALDKVTELAVAVLNNTAHAISKVQKVTVAFIACALAFDNGDAIDNKVNKQFLSNNDVSKMVANDDIAEYVSAYQHKYITGGKDTQSSQVRNVLDVLGLGSIVSNERARGAIMLNGDSFFFDWFRASYLK